jgi:hypothetical protein
MRALMRAGILLGLGLKDHREHGTSGSVSVIIHVSYGEPAKLEFDAKLCEKVEK